MRRGRSAVRRAFDLARTGQFRRLWQALAFRLYSQKRFVVLARVLTRPWTAPQCDLDFQIRPLEESEWETALELAGTTAPMRRYRRKMLAEGIGRCWVAETPDGICYLQFVCTAQDNPKLQKLGPHLPLLSSGEAVLEAAFTPKQFRRRKAMSAAASLISEQALELGCSRIVTVVAIDNEPSLRGAAAAGFEPDYQIEVRRILFGTRVSRRPLDPAD